LLGVAAGHGGGGGVLRKLARGNEAGALGCGRRLEIGARRASRERANDEAREAALGSIDHELPATIGLRVDAGCHAIEENLDHLIQARREK